MPRSLGRYMIAYDQRTGMKVRARDLVEDGEIPGLMVRSGTEDHEHPQKRLRRVGPDATMLYRAFPPNGVEAVTVRIGLEADPDALAGGRMGLPIIGLAPGPCVSTGDVAAPDDEGDFFGTSYFGPSYFGSSYFGGGA